MNRLALIAADVNEDSRSDLGREDRISEFVRCYCSASGN